MGFWICVLVCVCVWCMHVHMSPFVLSVMLLLLLFYLLFWFVYFLFVYLLSKERNRVLCWVGGEDRRIWVELVRGKLWWDYIVWRTEKKCVLLPDQVLYLCKYYVLVDQFGINFQHCKSLFQKTDILALYILYLFILISLIRLIIAFTY